MKVLYVLRYFPTLTETFVYREITELRRRGVDVEIVAIDARADGALQDEAPDAIVHRPPSGAGAAALVAPVTAALATAVGREAWAWLTGQLRVKEAARAAWLASLARERGADRLHVHFAGEAAEWARGAAHIAGVPYSVTVHAVDLFRPRPGLAAVLEGARPVVTVAAHHRQWIWQHYGVDATVVRCGVAVERYPTARPDGVPMRVISVGRDVPKKGMRVLLEAVTGLDVELRLVSDIDAGPDIRAGLVPPSAIPGLLAASDLFVLLCQVGPDGDRDGIPVALIEAMAAGLPVLTTPVSGIPELVDGEVGWVVPPEDAVAARAALVQAGGDPSERLRRGQAARRRVVERGFTVHGQVGALLDAWQHP